MAVGVLEFTFLKDSSDDSDGMAVNQSISTRFNTKKYWINILSTFLSVNMTVFPSVKYTQMIENLFGSLHER